MTALAQFLKDPQEVLDYVTDWGSWLGADTISSSNFTVDDAGITKDSQTNNTTTATVWLSGGSVGSTYRVRNTIVTAGGRTAERTLEIKVENR